MEFAYVFQNFVPTEVFEPVKAGLVEADGKGKKKLGLEIDVPLMPNNGDCRVRMRFTLTGLGPNVMVGQAYVDGIVGKWLNFDFSNEDGVFLETMINALESFGDNLIASGNESKVGGE